MEKIQSAIEKARAARSAPATEASAPVPTPTAAVVGPKAAPTILAATPATAAAWEALPSFAADAARLRASRIVAFAGGVEAVTFDVMRTKVIQQMRANGWRRLAITSPTPSCGKSTIALNLAFSLARQKELRTILAELDLRRPALAKMLGLRGRTGFSQVLEGQADFADCAQRYGGGLALALNDGPVRNPAELLQASPVAGALATIEAHYNPDILLFDMPPMLVSDDTMAFIGQVDAVLLVAAAETTTIKEVDACERELASQTNVMGVVLNKCRYMGADYGYSYYG
ncbi:MAG: CpsD/CapB family tyrosine-protein kinase [Paracoccaceae bacterium]